MAFAKVYETIFQFWNNDKQCYLSNNAILERTGLTSLGGLAEAFMFFELHGELKRKYVRGKRYFVQPEKIIEAEDMPVDNPKNDSTKLNQGLTPVRGGSHSCERGGLTPVRHNNNNINNKNLKREEPRKKREALSENSVEKKSRKSYVPGDGWTPDEKRMVHAREVSSKFSISIEQLIYKFRECHQARGTVREDWQAEFGLFLSREKSSYGINSTISGNFSKNEQKSNVSWFNNNH